MKQVATAGSLSSGFYHVIITWQDANGKTLWDMPSINLPAKSLGHAIRVADAFNA
jgi:hypothetical protein